MIRFPYLASVLLGFALMLAVWSGLVGLQLGAPTETSRWTWEVIEHKEAVARDLSSPRLLVVAGSSALFNIRAARIEDALEMPTVNLGAQQALQLRYILEQARRLARPGDIVLLALEYDMYLDDGTPGSVLLDYVFARDPGYLMRVPPWESFRLVMSTDLERLWNGLQGRVREPVRVEGSYRSETLNHRGDETNNVRALRTPRDSARVADAEPLPLERSGEEHAWEMLDAFLAWAAREGVRIAATFPATLRFPEYEGEDVRLPAEIRAFYEARAVPLLGDPDTFMYPESAMYDTHYHLAAPASDENTDRLIRYLAELKRSSL